MATALLIPRSRTAPPRKLADSLGLVPVQVQESRRQIRLGVARAIEGAHCLGELQDACAITSQRDLNYLESVVADLLRKLREV